MAEPIVLEIEYTNKHAVALKDLTSSLNALASEYRAAQKRTATTFEQDKAELYITRIRQGSIIAELAPYAVAGMALVENANSLMDFCSHLRETYDYVLGRLARSLSVEKQNVQNLIKIVEPVIRESGAQLNINAPINVGDGGTFNLVINTGEAREVKERGKIILERLDAPRTEAIDNVRLYWYQARNEKASSAGDRAIIPEISDKPAKVIFSTERIKERMLTDEANPFKMAYRVDVVADLKGNKPKLYRIVKVHGAKHR